MNGQPKKITVTALQSVETGIITAFFNELPGLVVQGKSDNEVKDKLGSLLKSYAKRLDSIDHNFEIQMAHL